MKKDVTDTSNKSLIYFFSFNFFLTDDKTGKHTQNSVYVNIRQLTRGDLILPADQLISNLLAQIGDLILVTKSVT